jgi:hypothetical protein
MQGARWSPFILSMCWPVSAGKPMPVHEITSRQSGLRWAWALKNGQSGMIFQPPARAASTA